MSKKWEDTDGKSPGNAVETNPTRTGRSQGWKNSAFLKRQPNFNLLCVRINRQDFKQRPPA
jgi:hypothetical protein